MKNPKLFFIFMVHNVFPGHEIIVSLTCLFLTPFFALCSDRTDVESTHSSNISAHHRDKMHAIIPPDALYGSVEKRPKFAYVDAADFNDSKVSLLFHSFMKNMVDFNA